jgi:hypothetical protein
MGVVTVVISLPQTTPEKNITRVKIGRTCWPLVIILSLKILDKAFLLKPAI